MVFSGNAFYKNTKGLLKPVTLLGFTFLNVRLHFPLEFNFENSQKIQMSGKHFLT